MTSRKNGYPLVQTSLTTSYVNCGRSRRADDLSSPSRMPCLSLRRLISSSRDGSSATPTAAKQNIG